MWDISHHEPLTIHITQNSQSPILLSISGSGCGILGESLDVEITQRSPRLLATSGTACGSFEWPGPTESIGVTYAIIHLLSQPSGIKTGYTSFLLKRQPVYSTFLVSLVLFVSAKTLCPQQKLTY